jgi:hypothetical protein
LRSSRTGAGKASSAPQCGQNAKSPPISRAHSLRTFALEEAYALTSGVSRLGTRPGPAVVGTVPGIGRGRMTADAGLAGVGPREARPREDDADSHHRPGCTPKPDSGEMMEAAGIEPA